MGSGDLLLKKYLTWGVPEPQSFYKQARVRDAAVHGYARKIAAHDGISEI
jgi:hypothetical protein